MRQHQLMWEPILPLGGRPVLTQVNSPYLLKKVVVDRVDAEDGPYDVLHLGTGEREAEAACVLSEQRFCHRWVSCPSIFIPDDSTCSDQSLSWCGDLSWSCWTFSNQIFLCLTLLRSDLILRR